MSEKGAIFLELENSIKNYDKEAAIEAAKKALKMGLDPIEVIEKGLAKGLREVGTRYENGEIFMVELVAAAEAMKSAMKILEPEILKRKSERKVLGKVVLGTVAGDIHDIGKNIVASLLIAAGFEVYDLGTDVPVEKFIEKAKEVKADVIGASALLTTTMLVQKDLAEAIKRSSLDVKYIIGGAAVSPQWAEEIGAAYAQDASSAVEVIKNLIKQR
jgi:corrinoid protein of di/trimethylamine methyltransferase